MTDLSIMISFTSFQAYYVNLGPSAAEKNRESTYCFSHILAGYPIVEKVSEPLPCFLQISGANISQIHLPYVRSMELHLLFRTYYQSFSYDT